MKFGIYVHIPYCLQQCPYCDFATVRFDHPVTREDYTNILLQEIRTRNQAVPYKQVSTVYFGGGTPSLAGPKNIAAVIHELKQHFDLSHLEEVTLEINPGTVSVGDLEEYKTIGVTRYSVGVQTFNPKLLKRLGREHTVADTHQTLELLKNKSLLYTADLLFGLPDQSLDDLNADLLIFKSYKPDHISAYCLTVPDNNPLNAGRPSDEQQAEMFYRVEAELNSIGLKRYEVSNYAVPGKEARHNSLYWQDEPYWGIGMSAHSYFLEGENGSRFWNPPTIAAYRKQVEAPTAQKSITSMIPKEQSEFLTTSQALTDFCHTRLRTVRGLQQSELESKFAPSAAQHVYSRLEKLVSKGLVEISSAGVWRIAHKAFIISEQVFQEMTFLSSELD
jgi:oxygen-independent coproporphyrinogen-3 oxidase